MTLEELIKEVPALAPYFEHMPEELHNRYTIRVYPPGKIINWKSLASSPKESTASSMNFRMAMFS